MAACATAGFGFAEVGGITVRGKNHVGLHQIKIADVHGHEVGSWHRNDAVEEQFDCNQIRCWCSAVVGV